jgi:parallel beta-helix repeat protein
MILALAALLGTAHAATKTVTSDANAGPNTLRWALTTANNGDTIEFSGVTQIDVTAGLPAITQDNLTISGLGDVVIDGSGIIGTANGLVVEQADGVTIRGMKIRAFPGVGVEIRGATNTTIGGSGVDENAIFGNDGAGIRVIDDNGIASSATTLTGNRVGLRFNDSISGNCANPLGDCAGVLLLPAAGSVTVSSNTISGNHGDGIRVHTSGVVISGNGIGISASGTLDKGNDGNGILVSGTASDVVLGGDIALNVISGNGGDGLRLASFAQALTLTSNGVGVDLLGAPLGNDGDGISISSSGHLINGSLLAPSIIAANGGSGVRMGGFGNTLQWSHIGVDDSSPPVVMGNGEVGVRVVNSGASTPHTIGGSGPPNVISGNDLGGVWVDAPHVVVQNNVIGLGADEVSPAPNGANPGGATANVFGGVWVTAPVAPDDTPPVVSFNLVSGNEHHGIWVRGGLHDEETTGVVLDGNEVGTTGFGGAQGNLGDGVRIEGADGVEVRNHVIAGNTGAGVHVTASAERASTGFVIEDNLIGDVADTFGNDGSGVLLDATFGGLGVTGGRVVRNIIHHNADYGIYSANGAAGNEVSQNTFYANDRCMVAGDDNSNYGDAWPAPEVVSLVGTTLTLSFDDALAPVAVDRIEVFVGIEDEATYDGDALLDPATGDYVLLGSTATSIDEVRGVVIGTEGTSSAMTPLPDDGCSTALCAQLDPLADDWCTFTYWDGTACVEHVRPDGYLCDDGDVNTGIVRYGQEFEYVPGYTGDAPDHCLQGVCQGGTPTTDPMDCPFATECNIAVRDVDDNMCRYNADCVNGECQVDMLGNDTACDACGDITCLSQTTDLDGDLIPDHWEWRDLTDPFAPDWDWNCDGINDPEMPAGATSARIDEKNVYLFIAWMADSCPDKPYTTANLAGIHHHRPDQDVLAEIEDAFFAGGDNTEIPSPYVLVIEEQCIPEYTQMAGDTRNNVDPDCDGHYDHISVRDLKARYFAPWRRGIYSFGVMGHGFPERENTITPDQQADGKCTSTYGRLGEGEIYGDDFRVMHQRNWDPTDPNLPAVNHVAETDTLFHEFGHNLNLWHGGRSNANRKPNYQSRMNYTYGATMEHIVDGIIRDYSHEAENEIYETSIDEFGPDVFTSKLAGNDLRKVEFKCAGPHYQPVYADGSPIDFDCDGAFSLGLQLDLNNEDGDEQTLTGFDDWEQLGLDRYCGATNDWDDLAVADERTSRFGPPRALIPATVDLAPACPTNAVPLDDDTPIQLVLYGEASWSVSDLDPRGFSIAGGRPRKAKVTDTDGDGYDDVRLWFRASDLPYLKPASETMLFNARTTDNDIFYATPMADPGTWADGDGDGVIDPCDACPASPPDTAVGADGC